MDSGSRAAASLLVVVLAFALSLAGPGAADMRVVLAGGKEAHRGIDAAVRQLMGSRSTAAATLEDGVAPELSVDLELHRRILGVEFISPGALNKDRAVCIKKCSDPGNRYTPAPRGCKSIYRCPSNSAAPSKP